MMYVHDVFTVNLLLLIHSYSSHPVSDQRTKLLSRKVATLITYQVRYIFFYLCRKLLLQEMLTVKIKFTEFYYLKGQSHEIFCTRFFLGE